MAASQTPTADDPEQNRRRHFAFNYSPPVRQRADQHEPNAPDRRNRDQPLAERAERHTRATPRRLRDSRR